MADDSRKSGLFDPDVWRGRVFLSAVEDSTSHLTHQAINLEWRTDGHYILRPVRRGDFPVALGLEDGLIRILLNGQLGPRLLRKAS